MQIWWQKRRQKKKADIYIGLRVRDSWAFSIIFELFFRGKKRLLRLFICTR
ncbi:PRA1 family protein B1 [Olea europaea subsp. europaea]|uniref:PRA1 family protein B1 n=1 Tax=Olea europaea subsp. europaea TaxID=158383 RepID=A0A8S0TT74_OLEEU|nr:PRA1 family protein B1 [Olea europaea subsp. europaea]